MTDLDTQRKRFVDRIDALCGGKLFTLRSIVEQFPPGEWDWDLFDEAMQREELYYDDMYVGKYPHEGCALTVDILLADTRRKSIVSVTDLVMWLRSPVARGLEPKDKFVLLRDGYGIDQNRFIEMMAEQIRYECPPPSSTIAVRQATHYRLNELMGSNNNFGTSLYQRIATAATVDANTLRRTEIEKEIRELESALTASRLRLKNLPAPDSVKSSEGGDEKPV